MVLFDIDGVITNGVCYKEYQKKGNIEAVKGIQLKDMDAISMLKDAGYIVGCISGENSSGLFDETTLDRMDISIWGCKNKGEVISRICDEYHLKDSNICYVGDGKYDIPVLKRVGLAICPGDAIAEVKDISSIILNENGGQGCLASVYSLLTRRRRLYSGRNEKGKEPNDGIVAAVIELRDTLDSILSDNQLLNGIQQTVDTILRCYRNGGKVLACGNGGSAVDVQHFVAELVAQFNIKRRALDAKALTDNAAIITAIANDYDFLNIFSRQIEAYGKKGDVLIALTTSGRSENIRKAIQSANEAGITTIMITGCRNIQWINDDKPGIMIRIPSESTPRIQETTLLLKHIICEQVEKNVYMSDSIRAKE